MEEYRKEGYKDIDSKYGDTCSYSNTFVDKLGEDTFIILYNNLKYDEGDGVYHKAAFVRKIRLENKSADIYFVKREETYNEIHH